MTLTQRCLTSLGLLCGAAVGVACSNTSTVDAPSVEGSAGDSSEVDAGETGGAAGSDGGAGGSQHTSTGGSAQTGGAGGTDVAGGSGGQGGDGPEEFSPKSIENLALWLDASAGVVTDEAGKVSKWNDQSAHDNDAVQATDALRPLLVEDFVNERPVLQFDGASSKRYLEIVDAESLRWGTGDFSVHIVASYTNTEGESDKGDQYGMLFGKFETKSPWIGVTIFANTNWPTFTTELVVNTNQVMAGGQVRSTIVNLNDGVMRLYSVRRAGDELRLRINHQAAGTGIQTEEIDVSAVGQPVYVGAQPTYQFLKGEIAEIVAVGGSLSEAEFKQIGTYLTEKYDL